MSAVANNQRFIRLSVWHDYDRLSKHAWPSAVVALAHEQAGHRSGLREATRSSRSSGPQHASLPDLAAGRIDEDARIHDAGGVEGALRGSQRGAEEWRDLLLVAGPVVAADGVVVRDRAAERDADLVGRDLDVAPAGERVLELAVTSAHGRVGEVGRRAVGIDVGETAGDPGLVPADLADRPRRALAHRLVEALEAVPGYRGLESVADHAEPDREIPPVRHADECVPPLAGRALAAHGGLGGRGQRGGDGLLVVRPAMVGDELQRAA